MYKLIFYFFHFSLNKLNFGKQDIIASLIKFNAKGWDRSKVHELWHEYLNVGVISKIVAIPGQALQLKCRPKAGNNFYNFFIT